MAYCQRYKLFEDFVVYWTLQNIYHQTVRQSSPPTASLLLNRKNLFMKYLKQTFDNLEILYS